MFSKKIVTMILVLSAAPQVEIERCFPHRRSEDDHRYWFAEPTPSLGPLYPHNTYHGAPTATGSKQHARAPLNLHQQHFSRPDTCTSRSDGTEVSSSG